MNKVFTDIHTGFYICMCMWICDFIFLGLISSTGVAGSSIKYMFKFVRNGQTDFQSVLPHQQRVTVLVASYPHRNLLFIASYFDFSHSNRCVAIFHHGFNLYFSNNLQYRSSFPVLTCHLIYILVKYLFKFVVHFY